MIVNDNKVLQRLEVYLISEQTKLCNEIVSGLSVRKYRESVAKVRALQSVISEIASIKKDLAEER